MFLTADKTCIVESDKSKNLLLFIRTETMNFCNKLILIAIVTYMFIAQS